MKRLLLAVSLLLISANGMAGVKFGLGKAAADRSSKLIDKAKKKDPDHAPDYNGAAAALPSCNSTGLPLTVLPLDLTSVTAIYPLGNLAPSGHTFPSDHHNIYMNRTVPGDLASPPLTVDILSPGNITITDLASTEYLSASPVFADYAIEFYPCRELRMVFGHVRTLSPALAAAAASLGNCFTYTTGGAAVRRCDTSLTFHLAPGDQVGTSPGVDLGAYDLRKTPLPFISPQRQGMYKLYAACPSDYFTPGMKAAMDAKTGRYDGLQWRTDLPVCGQIMYDIPNRAQGEWFKPGEPDIPEDPHLALVHNPVTYALEAISAGNSTPDLLGVRYFVPAASGRVNRDFADVRSDGNVYCYDSFQDPQGGEAGPFAIILDMPTDTTLRIEKYAPGVCGSPAWTMSGAAVTFQR